jgi:hypothetical protein
VSIPNPKFKPKSGFWRQGHDGLVYWNETDITGDTTFKLYKPLELENISREADFKIVFIKEIENPESFTKTKRWFAQDCHIELRKDVSENIVFKFSSDRRYYISDLTELGFTCQIDIENSTETVILEKTEPYLITQKEAQEFLKLYNYGFSRILKKSDGSLEYYRTV